MTARSPRRQPPSNLSQYLSGLALDIRRFLTGRRDPEVPPVRLQRVGRGDFREMSRWLAAFLVTHGLEPHHRVLDIGCGIGRAALGLSTVMSPVGSYDGFDADARAIRWCRRNFTPRHPNFRFVHADVRAGRYHRAGASAAGYRLPWPNATFDFAFATSVFTHLELETARQYFAEAARVLRPGGLLVATAFLLDDTPGLLQFPVDRGTWAVMDARYPTGGVGFRREGLDQLMGSERWAEVKVERGDWRSVGTFSVKGQDVIVARRQPTP